MKSIKIGSVWSPCLVKTNQTTSICESDMHKWSVFNKTTQRQLFTKSIHRKPSYKLKSEGEKET